MAFPYPYVGPIALYNNLPIESQNYQPSRFVISAISLGQTTTITTSTNHNFVVGQQVRLLIPFLYDAQQLNNVSGLVLSIPAANQMVLNINSSRNVDPFFAFSPTANITGITKGTTTTLTINNSLVPFIYVLIQNVGGMTQLNGNTYVVLDATPTTIKINVNSLAFNNYTSGGTATAVDYNTSQPQVVAIGDINSGVSNNTGRVLNGTYVPGSFINIST